MITESKNIEILVKHFPPGIIPGGKTSYIVFSIYTKCYNTANN